MTRQECIFIDMIQERVEVFKTNVCDPAIASALMKLITAQFQDCEVNFDLDDCDKILRVKSSFGFVHSATLISLVNSVGYHAEILKEDGGCLYAKQPGSQE